MNPVIMTATELLPNFSIVLETENLANADIAGLTHSLTSLLNQDLPLLQASEVLLIESGDIPPVLLEQLQTEFPWMKIYPAPPDTGYYKAKMLGAELATGEVVVYCDSDCIYEPHWLRSLLAPFSQNPAIQVVAGETTTRGSGPYGTAMALTYIFPQYSGETDLAPTSQYFLNNVAFRRDFLLKHPIPAELPLYRGNCVIHAYELRNQGCTIWRQPQARSTHAPPNGLDHFFWRFLLIGHDYYWQKQLLKPTESALAQHLNEPDPTPKGNQMGTIFSSRVGRMVRNNPAHIVFLPLALPIVLAAALLIFIGYWITVQKPRHLQETYDRHLAQVH